MCQLRRKRFAGVYEIKISSGAQSQSLDAKDLQRTVHARRRDVACVSSKLDIRCRAGVLFEGVQVNPLFTLVHADVITRYGQVGTALVKCNVLYLCERYNGGVG